MYSFLNQQKGGPNGKPGVAARAAERMGAPPLQDDRYLSPAEEYERQMEFFKNAWAQSGGNPFR
jgi:hypothetical protein